VIFKQLGAIFQAFRHIRAVEIRAQAHVVRADELHDVVNVLDNLSQLTEGASRRPLNPL